jgi:hypothetical protein
VDALDRTRRQYLAQMRILVERQLAELDAVGVAGPPARPTPAVLPAVAASAPVSPGLPTPPFLEVTEGA